MQYDNMFIIKNFEVDRENGWFLFFCENIFITTGEIISNSFMKYIPILPYTP